MAKPNRDEHPREVVRNLIEKMIEQIKVSLSEAGIDANVHAEELHLPDGMGGIDLSALLGGDKVENKRAVDDIENEMKQKAAILMADADLKDVLRSEFFEAHGLLHDTMEHLQMCFYLAAQLVPDTRPNAERADADPENVQAFRRTLGRVGLAHLELMDQVCRVNGALKRGAEVPGVPHDAEADPQVDDFGEFMKQLEGKPVN
jgi:hypothetical protein